jgi:hypothetical protein
MTCIQVTQRKPKSDTDASGAPHARAGSDFFNHVSLTKHQARMLAVELMLFAEGREVEEFESDMSEDEEPSTLHSFTN